MAAPLSGEEAGAATASNSRRPCSSSVGLSGAPRLLLFHPTTHAELPVTLSREDVVVIARAERAQLALVSVDRLAFELRAALCIDRVAGARTCRRCGDAALAEIGEPRLHHAGRAPVNRFLVTEPGQMRQAWQDFTAG